MGAEHSGRLIHLNILWLMRKGAGETQWHNDLLNDSSTAGGLPNSYTWVIFYALESVKQLHAGNMKNLLDDIVLFKRKTQFWIYRIENVRISAFWH